MKLYNYKREGSDIIAFKIQQAVPKINLRDKDLIEDVLDDYRIIKKSSKEEKSNIAWRVTAPIYAVCWLSFVFILLPIKWVFTGKYSLEYENPIVAFMQNWQTRLSNE